MRQVLKHISYSTSAMSRIMSCHLALHSASRGFVLSVVNRRCSYLLIRQLLRGIICLISLSVPSLAILRHGYGWTKLDIMLCHQHPRVKPSLALFTCGHFCSLDVFVIWAKSKFLLKPKQLHCKLFKSQVAMIRSCVSAFKQLWKRPDGQDGLGRPI